MKCETGRLAGLNGDEMTNEELLELVQRNIVSPAEARGKAANKDNFAG